MPSRRIVHAYPPKPKRLKPVTLSTPTRIVTARTVKDVDKRKRLLKLRSETGA